VSEGFFPGGSSGFVPGEEKDFSREAKYVEISFFPLETKKATFFARKMSNLKI